MSLDKDLALLLPLFLPCHKLFLEHCFINIIPLL
jgi:hypothetical protein